VQDNELFGDLSWLQVMHGQRIHPRGYHPFADLRPAAEVDAFLDNVEGVIAKCVQVMPTQAEFIAAHCSAKPQP
jgi:tryptophan halogenase